MITKSKRIIDLTSIELTNTLLVEFQEALQKSEERLLKLIKGNEKTPEKESKILSIQETAELFNVTRATIHDWMNKGIIKHYKKCSVFLFASTCENLPFILLEAMSFGLPIL